MRSVCSRKSESDVVFEIYTCNGDILSNRSIVGCFKVKAALADRECWIACVNFSSAIAIMSNTLKAAINSHFNARFTVNINFDTCVEVDVACCTETLGGIFTNINSFCPAI